MTERAAWAFTLGAASRAARAIDAGLGAPTRARRVVDVASGMVVVTADAVGGALRIAGRLAVLMTQVAEDLAPPLARVVRRQVVAPVRARIARLEDRGRAARVYSEAELDRILDVVVPKVVAAVLDRIDLTEIVTSRVDVDAIAAKVDVEPIAARVDVDAILDRVDLAGVTEDVLETIDLPEIIRQSTGSIASDTIVDVRLQGIQADQAVGRFVDRVFGGRRRATRTPTADETPKDADDG